MSIGRGWPRSLGAIYLDRFDLGSFLRGKRVATEGGPEIDPSKVAFSGSTPAEEAYFRGTDFDYVYAVFCDYQPLGDYRVRQFLLTDVLKYDSRQRDLTEEEKSTPVWSFDVFRYHGKYDKKEEDWVEGKWKLETSLPVTFREPFFALGRGEDWYFLTHSGRLFLSPDPGKGKKRKIVPVWEDRDRRILGQVQDATTGKTFLFVPPANRGGKRAFFELSDKPRLVEYDPKLVPLPPLEEPHRTIVHAARILVTLKKIEGKLPAKEKP